MTDTGTTGEAAHVSSLTEADEISLAESIARTDASSVPDTLEVRSDSMAVMRNSTAPLRRPLGIAAAVVGLAVVVVVVSGLLGRARRGGSAAVTP